MAKYNPYRKNPKLRKKKNEYQRRYNKKPSVKKKSEERWNERRRRGIAGKGGKDLSHTSNGKMVLESATKNRARNGQNGKSTLKKSAPKRKTTTKKRTTTKRK